MSTHRIEVVQVRKERHPNADLLSLVKIFGYTCVVKTTDWEEGQLAAYIPPDYVVPLNRPEFAWLQPLAKPGAATYRVKTKKFRNVYSQGLLVPAPAGLKEGDDALQVLGVERYVPPDHFSTGGDNESIPTGYPHIPTYDVEPWERYKDKFRGVSDVVIAEKIHGANARYTFDGTRFWCGSRTGWKVKTDTNLWWKGLERNPELQQLLKNNPKLVFFGEIFGQVQDLKYGTKSGEYLVLIFDIWDGTKWLEYSQIVDIIPETLRVPVLGRLTRSAESDDDWLRRLNEHIITLSLLDSSLCSGQLSEGCVVRAVPETSDPECSRLVLKKVSDRYLERQ